MKNCPFCNASVTDILINILYNRGNVKITIQTKCDCFRAGWVYFDHGEVEEIRRKAIEIWNNRPMNL